MSSLHFSLLLLLCLNFNFHCSAQAASPATNKWFTVTRDVRKCVSPLCGGFFATAVNQATTRCANGVASASCYVAEIDLDASLGDLGTLLGTGAQQVLFGSIVSRNFSDFGNLGALVVSQAWTTESLLPITTPAPASASETATATAASLTFFNVTAGTIMCIKAPCPPFAAVKLNTGANLGGIWQISPPIPSLDNRGAIVTGKAVKKGTPNATIKVSQLFTPYPPPFCGGRGGKPCPAGTFCNFPETSNCGRADGPGECIVAPMFCTLEYAPVCGCNGKTYGNACGATAAGVSIDYHGVCGKQVCGPNLPPCRNDNGYCLFTPASNKCGTANTQTGVCADRPQICNALYAPVCGCDAKTYSNSCAAASAGVNVRKNGAC